MKLHELFPTVGSATYTFSPRLDEVRMAKDRIHPELDAPALKRQAESFKHPQKIIPLEGNQYELKIAPHGVGLFRDGKLLAFMDLQGASEFGTKYLEIKLIYVVPEARGGKALLVMLNGTRSFLKTPLLIGSAAFRDGISMINALNKRDQFKLSVLNFKTGDVVPYTGGLINDDDSDIIIEGFSWPAYIQCISTRLFD